MPTPRKYLTDAERQAAYRARHATTPSQPPVPPVPGYRRWTVLIRQAHGLLADVAEEMARYETARSDAWHDSERGERFQERCEGLHEALSLLDDLAEA